MLITYEAFQSVALSHTKGEAATFALIDCTIFFFPPRPSVPVLLLHTFLCACVEKRYGCERAEQKELVICRSCENPEDTRRSERRSNILFSPSCLPAIHSHTYTCTHSIAARQGRITRDVLQLAQQHSPETMATPLQ